MTTTALATTNNNTLEVAGEYLKQFGNKLTETHRNQFLNICRAFNLNPFIREIYGVPYGNGDDATFSIIVGYEVYLKRAENSGVLDGWKAWTEGTITKKTITKAFKKKDGGTWNKEIEVWEGDLKGCIEIYRKDRNAPFYHEVDFTEYNQENAMWNSKPKTMIKKVAIAQGFRMAFPVELGGLPYTADEIAAEPATVTPLKAVASTTIDRKEAEAIKDALHKADIPASALFEYFKITRLGELEKGELDSVNDWIAEHASIPAEVEEVKPEPETGSLAQEVFALLAKLAEIKGDSPDDVIDGLTKGKVSCQIDLEDKPAVYLNDIKLMIENAITAEANNGE